jgi:hypothetical protein
MSSKAARRRELFEVYAANAAYYAPQHAGKFVCPICAVVHGPEAARPENLGVDLAHVYPRSCGGKLQTLTCSKCNSTIGSKYDSQLTIEHRGHADIKTGRLAARVFFQGGNIGVTVRKTSDTHIHYNILPDRTNPAHLEAFKALIATKGAAFQTQFKWIHSDRHNAAVLHSAYLAMFRQFGYEYIAFANAEWIRQILLAQEPPPANSLMTIAIPADADFDLKLLFATGLVEFQGKRFLCVVLPSPQPDQRCRIVILPGLDRESAEAYRELLVRPEPAEPIAARYRFECDRNPEPRLASEKGVGFLHWLWSRPI